MDRFGKLFGRKPEQTEVGDLSALDPQAKPAAQEPPRPAAAAPQSPDTTFGLKFVFDNGQARTFTRLPVTLGRAEGNDLVLNDETVSANHAVVMFDERLRDICILDLDSLNGVYIADQPTRKNVLQDGARIGLGNTHLVYRDTGYIHPA